jgi:hypothetical protein
MLCFFLLLRSAFYTALTVYILYSFVHKQASFILQKVQLFLAQQMPVFIVRDTLCAVLLKTAGK